MTTVSHRHERIGEEIAHEINAMLAGELKDPRLEISVVVNEVRIAADMRHARMTTFLVFARRSGPGPIDRPVGLDPFCLREEWNKHYAHLGRHAEPAPRLAPSAV